MLKNYRPVSLLPICGKIFEKLIFNALYSFFQSVSIRIQENDSCMNQLVSITYETYSAFDCDPFLEVRGLFVGLFKAFDKAWWFNL